MIDPVVIGATGGSGTRVVARIVGGAGVFIGTNRNASEDALEFVPFYDRWINRFVQRRHAALTDVETATMAREFHECIDRHRAGIAADDAVWGWKEPRSLYLLPFLCERFADMRFIHVVRDGRDMAFSSNQNQLRKHGTAVLPESCATLPVPAQAAALWSTINLSMAAFAETTMGRRYLRVRFEDLCREPDTAVRTICAFMGSSPGESSNLSEISPPDSIGRWRQCADADLIAAIQQQAAPALARFGYLPSLRC